MKTQNRFHIPKSPFVALSLVILLSLFWSIFSVQLQSSNDNQLIKSHLPQDATSDHGALGTLTSSTGCAGGVTIMNVVAHQDDDLLFINPNIMKHIDMGHCVRTVYLTAGDAGQNNQYWISRERGSQAAYSSLLGIDINEAWAQKTIKLANDEFVTEASPNRNKLISLIFMRLPDGNVNGRGFSASNYESIASLISGKLPVIHSIDGQSSYSSDQLTSALLFLIRAYQPTEINTLSPGDVGNVPHDHSDHVAVGQYAQRAQSKYANGRTDTTSIYYYVGYPISGKPENVSGNDLRRKIDTFVAYGQFDGATCSSISSCERRPDYWSYLHRQYTTAQWDGGK